MLCLGWIGEELEWDAPIYFPACQDPNWVLQPNQLVDNLLPWSRMTLAYCENFHESFMFVVLLLCY
jgi:hypothetical protein